MAKFRVGFWFFVVLSLLAASGQAREKRIIARVFTPLPEVLKVLGDLHLDIVSGATLGHADVLVTTWELEEIQRRGFRVNIIQAEEDVRPIPPEYHTVEQTWVTLDSLHRLYPSITKLDTCGYSQRFHLPLPHFVISRNVGSREDEPSVLLDGVHHANEPLGNEICLFTMGRILQDYPDSANARRWVDSMELHFVPIVNPDGWKYITDSSLTFPWWRKNLRDNGNNGGSINPDSDGVDLNRNYDWRWSVIGSSDPTAGDYYGPSPASESEVGALRTLAYERRFVVGVSYHSYGREILFPWHYNSLVPPDYRSLFVLARDMSYRMPDYRFGFLPYGCGMTSGWLYGQLGTYDISVETGTSFFPPAESIALECQTNYAGAAVLFNRPFRSGITGHVRDSLTLQPLQAVVEVNGLTGDSIAPRFSDSLFGRYYRFLWDSAFSLTFSKQGYLSKTFTGVAVTSDSLTELEVLLARVTGVEDSPSHESQVTNYVVSPNPFVSYARLPGHEAGLFSLYDISGRKVGTYKGVRVGEGLSAGVYFLCPEGGGAKPLRVVKVR